jgi:4-diphosphocytidyl-2-C-methyl-D-erythritol kinase
MVGKSCPRIRCLRRSSFKMKGNETIQISAPAKVNLFLEVLGKRPDGYHDLRSLVVPVSLCDEVTLCEGPGLEVVCEEGGLPDGNAVMLPESDNNLAMRAAKLLQGKTGLAKGARIKIRKAIPIGGGLGGGSADAAAVLVGLNRLWGAGLPMEALMALGARLGSDIPAMVAGKAVRMEGRGERVTPLACRWPAGQAWWLVVVNPGFSVPTRDVYARYRTGLTSFEEIFNKAAFALEKGDITLASACLRNSLEETVFRKYPLLGLLAERLKAAGALGVLLSGSGASVFAMAGSQAHALAVEECMRRETGAWLWTRVAQVLPDGVMVAHGPLEARV